MLGDEAEIGAPSPGAIEEPGAGRMRKGPAAERGSQADRADAPPLERDTERDLGRIPVANESASAAMWAGSVAGATARRPDERVAESTEAFAEFLPEPFLVTDVHGTVLVANRPAEALFGRPRHTLVHRPLSVHLPPDARSEFGIALRRLVSRGRREERRVSLRIGGEERSVQLTIGVRRDAQGQGREVWWLLQPVTTQLHEESKRAREAKSAFLAVMSHELRTPLTAIMGYTELLADGLFGPVSSEQRVQLARVRESSEHLLRVVEEVLQYARLDAGRERPALEELDVAEVVDQVLAKIRPLAERKGLSLRVNVPAGGLPWRSDPGMLRQILANLLGNAVKFTERGEVRLDASMRDDVLVIEVTDTGVGIPASMEDSIFEPFWQADQRFTRLQQGSGLGLSLTRELVALLGGRIEVRSSEGTGSVFTVWLPRRMPATGDRPAERRNG